MDKIEAQALRRDLLAVKETTDRVTEVVDINTMAFSKALSMVDTQIHVMQRIMNDLKSGVVYNDQSSGMIDFARYMEEYFATIGFIEFVSALKQNSTEVKEPEQENVVVFGG